MFIWSSWQAENSQIFNQLRTQVHWKLFIQSQQVLRVGDFCFSCTPNLKKVEIWPENKFFKMMNGKFVVRKSSCGSGVFDDIFFAALDIGSINIPLHIKVINDYANDWKQLHLSQSNQGLFNFFILNFRFFFFFKYLII